MREPRLCQKMAEPLGKLGAGFGGAGTKLCSFKIFHWLLSQQLLVK